ncbi:Mediator of RNA polymerase II transcription subunit 22 [Madurella mycetomatis]|uniref:Mediator of RNA polymerase II transcription subunit 22 n=1 Tax=Madurella mycetomatis TaxID=100816 RepID=A0A175W2X6_9PEZI|nr:Mediator of RNA polymerase II transcription subunit 22 [Madurella mycetomatis]
MTAFRDLVNHAAARVDSTASTGQAAYSSMALEIIMSSLASPPPLTNVKSTEDLLSLTRQLRELWVVGPLRGPGEGDEQAEAGIRRDAEGVFAMLNALRDSERQRLVAQVAGETGCLTLERAPIDGVPPPQTVPMPAQTSARPGAAAGGSGVQGQGQTPGAGDMRVKKEELGA